MPKNWRKALNTFGNSVKHIVQYSAADRSERLRAAFRRTTYGSRPMRGWLANHDIAPHIPVIHCPAVHVYMHERGKNQAIRGLDDAAKEGRNALRTPGNPPIFNGVRL